MNHPGSSGSGSSPITNRTSYGVPHSHVKRPWASAASWRLQTSQCSRPPDEDTWMTRGSIMDLGRTARGRKRKEADGSRACWAPDACLGSLTTPMNRFIRLRYPRVDPRRAGRRGGDGHLDPAYEYLRGARADDGVHRAPDESNPPGGKREPLPKT